MAIPLLVATHGLLAQFKLTPIALAVRGLIEVLQNDLRESTILGSGKGNARFYSDEPNELLKDDEFATEFIVALVTRGFFNG